MTQKRKLSNFKERGKFSNSEYHLKKKAAKQNIITHFLKCKMTKVILDYILIDKARRILNADLLKIVKTGNKLSKNRRLVQLGWQP